MRRILSLSILLAAAVFIVGCDNSGGTNSNNTNNTNTTTTNTATTSTTNTNSSNSSAASSSAMVSDADKEFVMKAASGGMLEVELGRLATQNAESKEVKQFGQRMVDDHTKANNELMQVVSSKSLNPPKELDAKGKETLARLSKLKNEEFDSAYMNDMVEDHTQDVADFQKEADQGADKDVKALASKTLPVLQEHLRMARAIAPKENKEAKQEEKSGKK